MPARGWLGSSADEGRAKLPVHRGFNSELRLATNPSF